MNRIMIVSMLLVAFLASSSFGQTGSAFGVKPGNTVNSAYFGIKANNFVPFIGADLIWISASGTYTEENYDSYFIFQDYYEWRNLNTNEFSGKAFLLIPHFGLKFFLSSRNVKPYLLGNVFLSIPSVSADSKQRYEEWAYFNGQLVNHSVDTKSDEIGDEVKDVIKDVLGFWGLTFAGGAEYFFSDHFSIGGNMV